MCGATNRHKTCPCLVCIKPDSSDQHYRNPAANIIAFPDTERFLDIPKAAQ